MLMSRYWVHKLNKPGLKEKKFVWINYKSMLLYLIFSKTDKFIKRKHFCKIWKQTIHSNNMQLVQAINSQTEQHTIHI